MSEPGTKMISAVFAFVRAAFSISRSTTCGRNAGSCAARYGPFGPAFSASRSIALAAGIAASSIALIGFGADSLIEALAGFVVLWLFMMVLSRSSQPPAISLTEFKRDIQQGRVDTAKFLERDQAEDE